MCTTSFSSIVCLVGVVALRSAATGQGCDRLASPAKPTDANSCDAGAKTVDFCDAEGACDVTVLLAGSIVEPQVRPIRPNCSSHPFYHSHTVPRPQLRTGRLAPNRELALWLFIEFLKLAPLFMGLGCIMMVCGAVISVALRQKWLDLSDNAATSKIRWTKPITC